MVCYLLRPLLWSSYSGDDVRNSQGPAWRAFSSISIWHDISSQNQYWMNTHGRLFPVSIIEGTFIFDIFDTRLSYKILQLVVTVLAWASFVLFVRIATRSLHYAALAGWFSLFILQFRNFHDPILQFNAQQPLVVISLFSMLSLLLITTRATSTRSFVVWLTVTTVVWILGCLTYETFYPLIIVPVLIIWRELAQRRRLAALIAIISPTVILLAFIMHLRSQAENPSTAYMLNFETWRFVPTFIQQITGTMPLSYPLLAPAGTLPRINTGWGLSGEWDVLALLSSIGILTLMLRYCRPKALDRTKSQLFLVAGILLLFVPSIIIGLTQRWQDGEITWGTPYISVFLSSFGLVLLELMVVSNLAQHFLFRRIRWWSTQGLPIVVIGAVGVCSLILGPLMMYDTNVWAVKSFDGLRTEREQFEAIVKRGTFDRIPDGSTVMTDHASSWFWENGAFIQQLGGPKQLNLITPADSLAASSCGVTLNCYKLVLTATPSGTTKAKIEMLKAVGPSLSP